MKTLAEKWLDGEVSLGKLLQESGVGRPSGDDLAGTIWQAVHKKVNAAYDAIQQEEEKAISECNKSIADVDKCSASGRQLGFVIAQNSLRQQFGNLIK